MEKCGNDDTSVCVADLPKMLEKFRSTLGCPSADWFDLIQMEPEDYSRVLRGEEDAPLRAFMNLTEPCGVTLESIMCNDVDFSAIAARLSGNREYLPERYAVGAYSKRISSINLLNYIEQFMGWQMREIVLRRLQVTEAVFQKPDELINVHFISDLCEFLRRYHCATKDFYSMGVYSAVTYKGSPMAQALGGADDLPEMYELLTQECLPKFVENNCVYRLASLDSASCVLEVHPNPDVLDALKAKAFGNPSFCMTKIGVTASVPIYKGLPQAKVVETQCIHMGASHCSFQVDFTWARATLESQRRRGAAAS